MDVSRAQLANLGTEVELIDPMFPWTVRVQLSESADRPVVLGLTVTARDGQAITSTALAQIPVRQLASEAASALRGEGEAEFWDVHYRTARRWLRHQP